MPLNLKDCFEDAEEQNRIAGLWKQVDIKYTEFKQSQLAQAPVSMFEEGAAAADRASVSGKRDYGDESGGTGPAHMHVRRRF